MTTIYTIGHSTRPLEELVSLLQASGVAHLVDVRTVPRSRRHPYFAAEALSRSLPAAGIAYHHMAELGGLRKPRPDSVNTAWRHEGFRGYADYMSTAGFDRGIEALLCVARTGPTAIMCAEAVWWRCHRQLIADALVARGCAVRHILAADSAPAHTLTEFARVSDGRVSYRGLI
jgi:uncharacterized protein (DUF488 family)